MPKPQPQDDDPSVIFKKWSGLKNTVTAERLTAEELQTAINIDLDDVGQPHRRRGRTLAASGSWGSLWSSFEGNVFAVKDGWLVLVYPNFSYAQLVDLGTQARLAYVQVGKDIYYSGVPYAANSCGGIINQRAGFSVTPWGFLPEGYIPAGDGFWFSPVVNPTKTLPPVRGKILGPPPVMSNLAYWNGRIYGSVGPCLWVTEHFLYNFVDKTRGYYQFEADITMVGAVSDGLYVGTKEGVWFLSGTHAEGLKRVRVMDTPAVEGSLTYLPGELGNPPQVNLGEDTPVKVSIAFMTDEGYCGGMDGGECYNYTENRMIFPKAFWGAGLFRRQDGMNHFIIAQNSLGDPGSNARIGDYVEAELIRAGTWRELDSCVKFVDAFTPDWS